MSPVSSMIVSAKMTPIPLIVISFSNSGRSSTWLSTAFSTALICVISAFTMSQWLCKANRILGSSNSSIKSACIFKYRWTITSYRYYTNIGFGYSTHVPFSFALTSSSVEVYPLQPVLSLGKYTQWAIFQVASSGQAKMRRTYHRYVSSRNTVQQPWYSLNKLEIQRHLIRQSANTS